MIPLRVLRLVQIKMDSIQLFHSWNHSHDWNTWHSCNHQCHFCPDRSWGGRILPAVGRLFEKSRDPVGTDWSPSRLRLSSFWISFTLRMSYVSIARISFSRILLESSILISDITQKLTFHEYLMLLLWVTDFISPCANFGPPGSKFLSLHVWHSSDVKYDWNANLLYRSGRTSRIDDERKAKCSSDWDSSKSSMCEWKLFIYLKVVT
jgi:hypothetical protein